VPNADADAVLTGMPRLVRLADESSWRGGAAAGAAAAVVGYWVLSWLVGQRIEIVGAPAAFGVALLPTLALGLPASRRRAAAARSASGRLPPGGIRETRAAARERRTRLAAIVLTGVLVLVVFDAATGGGGVVAGLLAGALLGIGLIDLLDGRAWRRAERERGVRLLALIRPDALTVPPAVDRVYEDRRGAPDPVAAGPSPFDL